MPAEQMGINCNTFCATSSSLAHFMADLVSKNGRFWAVLRTIDLKFQDGLPVHQVGVSNESRSSSMAIGLSNDCKWVFDRASSKSWCHNVVHFEVKLSCF